MRNKENKMKHDFAKFGSRITNSSRFMGAQARDELLKEVRIRELKRPWVEFDKKRIEVQSLKDREKSLKARDHPPHVV